jgi:DNA-binding LacI/PurR family transcriptional regulator
MPLVVWGAPERGHRYIVVGSDNRKGGISAAERFVEQGRQAGVPGRRRSRRGAGTLRRLHRCHGRPATVHIIRPKAFTFEAGFDSMSAAEKEGRHV